MKSDSTVLLVDDSKELLQVYSTVLVDEGYNVLTASDAKHGLQLIRENGDKIGLVLLDCFMPMMDGEEFIKELKKSSPEFYERTPIYGFSCASEEAPQMKRLLELVDGFFEKPDSFDDIVSFVEKNLD